MIDEPMSDEQLLASALNRILKREFPGETGPLKVRFQFFWKPDHLLNVALEPHDIMSDDKLKLTDRELKQLIRLLEKFKEILRQDKPLAAGVIQLVISWVEDEIDF